MKFASHPAGDPACRGGIGLQPNLVWGYPDQDVANLVLFLASDESRFITSEMISVDGV